MPSFFRTDQQPRPNPQVKSPRNPNLSKTALKFCRIFAAVLPPSFHTFSSPFSTLFPYSGFSPHKTFPYFCHPFSVHIPPSCRPDFSAAQPYQNGRVAFHPPSSFPRTSIPAGCCLLSTIRRQISEGTRIDSQEVLRLHKNPQDFLGKANVAPSPFPKMGFGDGAFMDYSALASILRFHMQKPKPASSPYPYYL